MASNNENSIGDRTIAELRVETETVRYQREPPPPYSYAAAADTNQPHHIHQNNISQQPIIHQTIILQAPLKNHPMVYECPSCRQSVLTKVKYVNSRKTHMLAGFICGCTFWCMLCCLAAIPYFLPTFKKTEHYCPICNKLIGSYHKP